ncbi:unnamed protein product [Durusdinium trenchii]|uniref:Uncharacterized protein n=1 Tax=Durusdinium trenchii TaxID=1381693 RepID=A0ABP0QYQ0_9DINO
MAAKALVDKLPFPLKDLDWSKLPDVANATGFGFDSAKDLMSLVMGGPPPDDIEDLAHLKKQCNSSQSSGKATAKSKAAAKAKGKAAAKGKAKAKAKAVVKRGAKAKAKNKSAASTTKAKALKAEPVEVDEGEEEEELEDDEEEEVPVTKRPAGKAPSRQVTRQRKDPVPQPEVEDPLIAKGTSADGPSGANAGEVPVLPGAAEEAVMEPEPAVKKVPRADEFEVPAVPPKRLGDSVTTVAATSQELELRAELAALQARLDSMQLVPVEGDKPPAPVRRIPASLQLDKPIFEEPDNQLGLVSSQSCDGMLPQPSLGPADTLEPVEPPSDPSTRVDTPQQPKMDPPSERADGVPQEPEPSERADTPHGQPDDPLPDTPQEPNMDAGTQLQDPKMDPPLPGPSQAPEQPSDLPDPQKADAQPVDEPGLEKPESENELPPQVIAETQLMDAPEAKVDPPNLPNPALPNPPGALPAALQQPVLPSLPKLALPIEPSMAPEQAQQPVQKADADVPKAAFTAQQPVQKAEAELPKAASEGPPDTKANASQPVEASKPLVDSDRKVKELQQQLRELGDRLIAMEAEKSKGAASSSSKGATWGSMPTFDATDVPLGDMLDGEPLDDDGTFDDALVGLIKETSSNGAREAAPATQAPSSNGSAETINFSTHSRWDANEPLHGVR